MEILEHVPLAPYTTLRIGGPARFFARATSVAELTEALRFARAQALPTFLLGGGSNLVVPDEGYPGLVLQAALEAPYRIEAQGRHTTYTVPAGVDWDAFVRLTCEAGLPGIESLAGIPGLVGGSPVQNIGAYGQEVAQTITHVEVLDRQTLTTETLPAAACLFSYRTSIFNSTHRNRYIVTAVSFRFALDRTPTLTYADLQRHFGADPHPTPLAIYHAVREIRSRKGMLITPGQNDPDTCSAGSFFKNPIVPLTHLTHLARTLNIPAETIPHWPLTTHVPEQSDPAGPTPDPTSRTGPQTKLPAAWLIEQAGFPKGYQLGPVGISTRHTLALVNRTGQATAAHLLALRDQITARIQTRFGILLHQEPVTLATHE